MRAPRRYVTYLVDQTQTNAASYHAGIGRTPEEAQRNSCYWANQFPVRTVAASRAPRWAVEQAIEALRYGCGACGGPKHRGFTCLNAAGDVLPAYAKAAREWQAQGRPALLDGGELA